MGTDSICNNLLIHRFIHKVHEVVEQLIVFMMRIVQYYSMYGFKSVLKDLQITSRHLNYDQYVQYLQQFKKTGQFNKKSNSIRVLHC